MAANEDSSLPPVTKPRLSKELTTRVASAIVLIPVALVTAYWGGWAFALFWLAAGIAVALAFGFSGKAEAQKTKLTIYTALENDQLGPFKQSIEKAVPEAEVVWVRDSTGVITARFLAEKDNPRADVVLGLAASSLLAFEKQGLLETYQPAGVDKLKPVFRDDKAPYTWTGMDAYTGVICFNTVEAERLTRQAGCRPAGGRPGKGGNARRC